MLAPNMHTCIYCTLYIQHNISTYTIILYNTIYAHTLHIMYRICIYVYILCMCIIYKKNRSNISVLFLVFNCKYLCVLRYIFHNYSFVSLTYFYFSYCYNRISILCPSFSYSVIMLPNAYNFDF